MTTSTDMPVYPWWDQVPENLKTATQLGKERLKPAGPVRARIEYDTRKGHRVYDLYDRAEAIEKAVATPAQLAALAQARAAQTAARYAADDAELDEHEAFLEESRDEAIEGARRLIAGDGWVILDTETTGLDGDAEIIQLAILAPDGTALLDTLIKPQSPIPPEATAVHGITDAMVADAPSFPVVYEQARAVLGGMRIVAYNREFDMGMWRQTRRRHGLKGVAGAKWVCAMKPYAAYCGEWSEWHGNFKWQPLPGGDHTAIGDCRATLELIKTMAAAKLSTEEIAEVH